MAVSRRSAVSHQRQISEACVRWRGERETDQPRVVLARQVGSAPDQQRAQLRAFFGTVICCSPQPIRVVAA
jgi:isochorismate hydrolase